MFLKIVFGALAVVSIAILVMILIDEGEDSKKHLKTAIVGALICAGLFILSCTVVIIPTGYTGVKTTFGQIDETPVKNGFNLKIPFIQSIEKVNNKQQDIVFEDKIWSETVSRTAIFYENITVTYQIDPQSSAWIYANVTDYESSLISSSLAASSIKSSSKTLSDSDATNRAIIEPLCKENLQKSLDDKYGSQVIIINKVVIDSADFEDGYNKAIAAKQKAQLEAETQQIENEKAVKKAEADAEVMRTNAQAKADARLIEAKSEADANKLLEKSLNDKILREQWIAKWDGKLPQYVAGDDAGAIIDFKKAD